MNRIHSLDGIRALAVSVVMASHFTQMNVFPGAFGVCAFFVVSGFIITHLLMKELDNTGTISLTAFYKRRVFRLLPALVASLLFAWAVQGYVGKDWIDAEKATASLAFVQNYYVIWNPYKSPLGMHWSLAVEEHFYMFFPALLLWIYLAEKPAVKILLSLCLAALLARTGLVLFSGWSEMELKDYTYKASEMRIDSILFGCIVAVLWSRGTLQRISGNWMLIVGLALLVATRASSDPAFMFTLKYTTQPVGIALVLSWLLTANNPAAWMAKWFLNTQPMVFIGKLSFSLYLFHTGMFYVTLTVFGDGVSWWILMPAATAGSVLVSWAVYTWIEHPFIRLGKQEKILRVSYG